MSHANDRVPVIFTEGDYALLRQYFPEQRYASERMSLAYELDRATVVKKNDFPEDCVRLGSMISIQDMATQKVKTLIIDLPQRADIRENRISILTPMAAAIIGFKKGEEVTWEVPGGMKRFRILEVSNG